MLRFRFAQLALGSLTLLAASSLSAETVAPTQVAAVIEGTTLASSTLIGTSGQIYEPTASGWKQNGRGGVACKISAAYKIGSELWAMCSSAPLFRRAGGVWSAEPLTNRGRTRPGRIGTTPLISVGRHLYGHVKGSWQRLASSPSRIKSLLAMSARSALAVSTRRELLRLSGKKWKVIIAAPKRRKPTDDLPTSIFGSSKNAYLVLDSGSLLHIGTRRRKPVALPSTLKSFSVGASCALTTGAVLAVGRDASGSVILLRFEGTTAELAGTSPTFADGERIGHLHCMGSEALLSTSHGRLLLRAADGTWTAKTIAAPPAETNKTTPGSRPAKSG